MFSIYMAFFYQLPKLAGLTGYSVSSHFFGRIKTTKRVTPNNRYENMNTVYLYAVLGGLGITAGAHRLWSHKSYKARLPLRIFLMLCNCIAGQNNLIEWCRDHRLHHKSSETDADPHNSNRGWFFAHMGWLLQRKHPKVIEMGSKLDLDDLRTDPVLIFQKRHYTQLALFLGFILPIMVSHIYFGETYFISLCLSVWRYVTALHCTWFVNSAAHIWGSKDYDTSIEPRESELVALGALT